MMRKEMRKEMRITDSRGGASQSSPQAWGSWGEGRGEGMRDLLPWLPSHLVSRLISLRITDPTQLTGGEGVWCYKSWARGILKPCNC